MSNIAPPPLNVLEDAAKKLFKSVDQDLNGTISHSEFNDWIIRDWELQDFLLKYAWVQTLPNSQKRGQERIEAFLTAFNTAS